MMDKSLYYDWTGLNLWLFKAINAIHGDSYDMAMVVISHLTDHHYFPYYIAFFLLYVLVTVLGRSIMNRAGTKGFVNLWVGAFAMMIMGYAINGAVIKTTKNYFEYPRPYVALKKSEVRTLMEMPEEKAYQSFPSGHVAFVTSMVFALWPVLSVGFRWFGVVMIAVVAWSRIAVGVHFPADVLGGFVITMIVMSLLGSVAYPILHKLGIKC